MIEVELNKKKAVVDKTGKVIVSPQYDDIKRYNFVETGLIKVKLNNKWGLIDQTGRIVVSPQYDDINCYKFVETGLIKVKLNNKWGLIDQTGQMIIPCQFDSIGNFYGGKATVTLNGEESIIDRQGNFIDQSKQNNLINHYK